MDSLIDYIEDVFYPVDSLKPIPPSEKRSMKVLALGLPRSGTESIKQALHILGYNDVYHGFSFASSDPAEKRAWAKLGRRKWGSKGDATPITKGDFDPILGRCEAVADQPCACFPLELIEAYPDAKVILNYRDTELWHQSIINTFGVLFSPTNFMIQYLSRFEASLYWLKQVFNMYNRGFWQGSMLRNAKRIQKEHHAVIKGAVESERLLVWRVQDGWEPLCRFLEKPVPDGDFPRGNSPEAMLEKGESIRAEARKKAYRNLGGLVVLLASVGVAILKVVAKARQ